MAGLLVSLQGPWTRRADQKQNEKGKQRRSHDSSYYPNSILSRWRLMRAEVPRRVERSLEKVDQQGCVMNDEPRRHTMPTFWDCFGHDD